MNSSLLQIWPLLLIGVLCSLQLSAEPPGGDEEEKKNNNRPYIEFDNIGKVGYYRDNKQLKKIDKLDENDQYKELLRTLEEYVSKFGIKNFHIDTELIWRLAQLNEKFGRMKKAKWLYRLILRHSDKSRKYVKKYYDSLAQDDQPSYVPIDYYYKLIEHRKQVDTLRPPKGELSNMGPYINSKYEDYGPALNNDNNILIFTSKRNRQEQLNRTKINENLYWSRLNENGSWTEAKPLENVNTKYNEGSPCLSKDGEELYFIRCKTPEGYGSCDIYVAENQGENKWGNVKNLGPNVNGKFWDSHPSLTPDGDTLFFASDRLDGFGGIDIYYTYRNEKGNWVEAKNVGPVINTNDNDLSPFFHRNNNVLYFSSRGHYLNFGDYDIYKAYFEDGHWTEPVNIGPIVNGEGKEHYFTIDSESERLFYSRSEKSNIEDLDLYSFPLPMKAKPKARTVLKGSLESKSTGEAFDGIVSVIDLEKGVEVAPKYLKPDGSFAFDLISNRKYLLVVQGKDFFRIEKELNLKGDTSLNMQASSVNFLRLQFESIEFKTNSAEILPKMKEDLDKLLDYILDNPSMRLKISGHTDSRGDPQHNLELSRKRAKAIKEYLVEKGGIDPSRITAKGYGSKKPIIKDANTEKEYRKNRRVEFEIQKPDEAKNPYEQKKQP